MTVAVRSIENTRRERRRRERGKYLLRGRRNQPQRATVNKEMFIDVACFTRKIAFERALVHDKAAFLPGLS